MGKWETTKLGNVANVQGGYAFKSEKFIKNAVPIIRIGNINDGTVDIDENTSYPLEFWEKNQSYHVKKDDILIALSGATVGKVGIYNDVKPALLNQRIGKINSKNDKVHNRYLFRYVNSGLFKRQVLNLAAGCAQPNISTSQIQSIQIPLPPLEIQRHIADTLDKTQVIIDGHKKQLEELDNLIKATFYDMFGDPALNTKQWKLAYVRDLAERIQYGTSEKASTECLQYPILRMNNITYSGDWDFTDLKYINLTKKDKEKYLVHKGELLFNRTNSKELVGKSAAFREEKPMAYAGYLVKLTPNKLANSEFISGYLNSKYGKALLRSMAKNIIGMANINAKELGNIKIYVPPIELQNKFAEIVTNIEEQKAIVKQSIAESETLYNSLMSKYFD